LHDNLGTWLKHILGLGERGMKQMLTGFRGPVQAEAGDSEFCIVFAAMGVNMETAHFFKQVLTASDTLYGGAVHLAPEGVHCMGGMISFMRHSQATCILLA
jgi:hypothetical protein